MGILGKVPKTHPNPADCPHLCTVSVVSAGLERMICEDCGLVVVRYESMITGDIERSRFSRRADSLVRGAQTRI